ncbi:MAG: phosphoribosylglycinamide formyltransferase [Firmicutes bacterium]|nr:phosphoribosylglycinamide formyltransferase [Bacillota bacterium]
MTKIAVFASGQGSNLQALIDASAKGELPARIELVVSDRRGCYALTRAEEAAIETLVLSPADYESRSQYEAIILEKLLELQIEYLVLAGFMRLIGPTLLAPYPERIINIHPSLLPLFPGKDAIGQALAAEVTETGVTIHYVDEGMDTGPIIAQERISVNPGEDRRSLEGRIHALEHHLYPKVLKQIFTGGNANGKTRTN